MNTINYTTIRDVQRNYRKISKNVNTDDISLVVMSNNRPQFVIVGLKSFSKFQKPTENNQELALLSLIDWAEEKKIEGPEDLSQNHDKYLWSKTETKSESTK